MGDKQVIQNSLIQAMRLASAEIMAALSGLLLCGADDEEIRDLMRRQMAIFAQSVRIAGMHSDIGFHTVDEKIQKVLGDVLISPEADAIRASL